MFLPTTNLEFKRLGWDSLDIILISGDVYIDSPYDGSAIIGKTLLNAGYKVGIISQPDLNSNDISRLGEPKLFWGVSGGAVDSMVANYTALLKPKRNDDLTPGGINNRRPDRACIRYCDLIRRYFKNTVPIIIGGIEASLRRIAHYDYWSDSIRRSILFDSRADYLVFGMGEKTILELADKINSGKEISSQRGICYISKVLPEMNYDALNFEYIELPSYESVKDNKNEFISMYKMFAANSDPLNAKGLIQKHGERNLIHNPPNYYPSNDELDSYFGNQFEYDAHPFYKAQGKIRALETIRFSITTHRGCFGDCNFCAINVHQGRKILRRSVKSILSEAERFTQMKDFKGYIYDLGGPTANMYEMRCKKQDKKGSCQDKRCTMPDNCRTMNIEHKELIELYKKVREISGVKKVFIQSGIRYDLVIDDEKYGAEYLKEVVENHVSGQLKIAPEHISKKVLEKMGKSENKYLIKFKEMFDTLSKKAGKKQFLTYYFIAAHPGCEDNDMHELSRFINKELKLNPEQVQIFTPTPSTWASLMYYTEIDPFTNKAVFVEKNLRKKEEQKKIIVK